MPDDGKKPEMPKDQDDEEGGLAEKTSRIFHNLGTGEDGVSDGEKYLPAVSSSKINDIDGKATLLVEAMKRDFSDSYLDGLSPQDIVAARVGQWLATSKTMDAYGIDMVVDGMLAGVSTADEKYQSFHAKSEAIAGKLTKDDLGKLDVEGRRTFGSELGQEFMGNFNAEMTYKEFGQELIMAYSQACNGQNREAAEYVLGIIGQMITLHGDEGFSFNGGSKVFGRLTSLYTKAFGEGELPDDLHNLGLSAKIAIKVEDGRDATNAQLADGVRKGLYAVLQDTHAEGPANIDYTGRPDPADLVARFNGLSEQSQRTAEIADMAVAAVRGDMEATAKAVGRVYGIAGIQKHVKALDKIK